MSEVIAATEDDSSVVSDNSFVILGQGSLSLEGNDDCGTQSINSLTNEEQEENCFINGDLEGNINSALPGTSSVGIQLKLEKLVKENLLLKETLNQSNLAMKNQFDTLSLWHEEVVKTHESHKQKFQETQDQIFKLRNENMNLKKLIQQNLERCCGNNSALVNLDLESINRPSDMETEKNSKEVSFHNMYIEVLNMKNAELERKLCDMTQEKLDLEKKLEKALEENSNLKKEAESKTDTCAESLGCKTDTCDKESDEHQDKEEPTEIISLDPDMSIMNKLSKSVEAELVLAASKQDFADLKKPTEIISLDPEISIINKLTKSVEAELVLAASKQDFADLKKQFDEQSEISLKNSEKLEKMMVLYDEIVAEKNRLKDELDQSKIVSEELTDKIASLNEELKIKDEQLERKVDEFEQIKKDMQKLVLDCEEVAILRAQVELYQNDFNEERKAREQAVGEKEKMAEQVRFLERSLSDFKRRDKENEKKASTSAAQEEKATLSYMCPKCMKRLPTLTECESHVDACLNLDMFP